MKKLYIEPLTEVIKSAITAQPLMISNHAITDPDDPSKTDSDSPSSGSGDNPGDFAKPFSLWDIDEAKRK